MQDGFPVSNEKDRRPFGGGFFFYDDQAGLKNN